MPVGIMTIISFVWTYVIPVLKDGIKVLNKGTYAYIKDRVDDADILELSGFEKRSVVYADIVKWLGKQGVDPSLYSSALIYLLIEIAVVNLRKKQNRLVKTG